MSTSVKTFIKDYAKTIKEGRAALFIGSGLSRPAGYMGWKDVLRDCAIELGLDVEKEESNLITLAEYYRIDKQQRTTINQTIKEFFSDNKGEPTETHRIIATLPITSIWTTNYDRLLERTYEDAELTYTVITDDVSYREVNNSAQITVHKIHGDVLVSDKCVITRKDYESFAETHEVVLAELKGEMCSKSFLFLGYSFSDTDIQQHVLSRIRLISKNSQPQKHYCILEKVKKENFKIQEDFTYAENKQKHHIADMQSYGLNVVLVDSYQEISDILNCIRKQVLLKNVFISGAYDENYQYAKRCADFSRKISEELIQNDFKLYTGFGENLGNDIVTGAFRGCSNVETNVKNFNKNVFIHPFPFKLKSTARDSLFEQIRKNMISNTQVMIVIGGVKIDERGTRITSEGVIKEVEEAKKQGIVVIALPTTGGAAMQVYDKLVEENLWYTRNEVYAKLKTVASSNEIWEVVKGIINLHIDSIIK